MKRKRGISFWINVCGMTNSGNIVNLTKKGVKSKSEKVLTQHEIVLK